MFSGKKCVPCEDKSVRPLEREDIELFVQELKGWSVSDSYSSIHKEFVFDTFVDAIDFINQVADIAEMEGHHPDIYCFYNKVTLTLATHSVKGLTQNDFILASKIDDMLM